MTAVISTPIGSRLDTALNRFTMYRLVLWVLAVLAAYSLLLNVLGWLTFGMPEMLAHLALCLGLTYASNRVLAALFQVPPAYRVLADHRPAAVLPVLADAVFAGVQLLDLAGVALACVLASASKYALAWRGRHIFNPAAAGAFITGLTGLNIATWWAATPAMLWLLLPGVLLVLYRVRKLLMAAVFTAVAVSIVAMELLQVRLSPGRGTVAAAGPAAGAVLRGLHAHRAADPAAAALAAAGAGRRRRRAFRRALQPGLRRQFPRAGAAGG